MKVVCAFNNIQRDRLRLNIFFLIWFWVFSLIKMHFIVIRNGVLKIYVVFFLKKFYWKDWSKNLDTNFLTIGFISNDQKILYANHTSVITHSIFFKIGMNDESFAFKKSSESVPFFNFGPNVLASFLKWSIIFYLFNFFYIKIIFK
jgi:hypothetical protein